MGAQHSTPPAVPASKGIHCAVPEVLVHLIVGGIGHCAGRAVPVRCILPMLVGSATVQVKGQQ